MKILKDNLTTEVSGDSSLVSINSDTILNSITDGVVVIGLDHRLLFINRAAREILEKAGTKNLVAGKKCDDVMCHSGCTMGCLLNRTVKTGEHLYNHEVTFGRGDRKLTISINTALLKDREGRVIGGIEIFRDVSLLKELASELRGRYSFKNIIGKTEQMYEVFELLREVAPTDATVLIEGETGTGKELIANAIHHNSPRSEGPFVKVNCAALSEGLLESELFGHVKGAFTGAVADKAGRFELANSGTLFLDEVGEISPHTQVKLLRVLQEGEFERVGGTKTLKADVRIVAATNRDLKAEVKRRKFREDLYYRLKVVPMRLPALRERKDDIPLLARYFIDKFNSEMGKSIINLTPESMKLLMGYDYPGNIRELEHIIEHGFVRCSGGSLGPEHLPSDVVNHGVVERAAGSVEPMKELERELILKTLKETGWKYAETGRRLGISRTTLWRRIKDLEIKKPAF